MNRKFALITSGFVSGLALIASTAAMSQDRDYRRDGRYDRDERYERDRYERDRYDRDAFDYGTYVGVSAGWLNYDEDGLSTVQPTILVFRVGQQFNPNFAIEGRLGTSIRGDETNDGFRVNAQAIYAGYVKGIFPVSPALSAYGLAGVGGVQIHRNYDESDTNDAGLSVGLGIEFALGRGASLNAEWVRLTTGVNDEIYDYTADQLTFGVNWRF